MEPQPLISVIVPCYNYGAYLKECINSLIQQTYKNWECIIVDNGSTDDSIAIAKNYAASDRRISFYAKNNPGPTQSRQFALTQAKGEFIQFLDADDLLQSQKFEKQLAVFKQLPDCDIVYGSVRYFESSNPSQLYNNLELTDAPHWMPQSSGRGDSMILPLLKGNIMVISAPLIRSEFFQKNNLLSSPDFPEDWELWLRLALLNAVFHYDDSENTLSLVRVHNKSISTNHFQMFWWGLQVCLRVYDLLPRRKYKKILVPKIAYHKKVLDRELLKMLAIDKENAIVQSKMMYEKSKVFRYALYAQIFKICPLWFCKLTATFIATLHKLKNTIVYA